MARLKEMYQSEIVDAMIKKFGYKNIMEVPKLDKIVINMGVGEAKENAKIFYKKYTKYLHKKKVCEILILYSVPCNFYFLIFIK